MIRPVLVIARRDIVATVFTRGFLIWLLMPLIGIGVGLVAAMLTAGGGRPASRPVAVIDAGGDLKPWLLRAAEEARVRASYATMRERHQRLRPDEPLPRELAPLPEDLDREQLETLSDAAALQRLGKTAGLNIDTTKLGAPSWLPQFVFVEPAADPDMQVRRLLKTRASGRFGAVLLAGPSGGMRLILASASAPDADAVNSLVNDGRELRALERSGFAARLATLREVRQPITTEKIEGEERRGVDEPRKAMAQATAAVLFMLIGLLAGVLLSNMIEEKASKVIEVLVASVPVTAIFAGKLIAMLAVSLIGVALWAAIIGGGAAVALAHGPSGLLPQPAVGWPTLLSLTLVYLVTAYLIYGAIYLGIGSLCASIREVQSLSLPVTIVQAMVLLGVMHALGERSGAWAGVMSWFPLSSPYMMAARAAIEPGIGVHIAAISWQLLFAALVIRLSARLFRYGVLNSGPPLRLFKLQKSSLL